MTVEDLELNRQVRTVFARNWINLQRLDYRCTHGAVYVRGRLAFIRQPPQKGKEEMDRAGVSGSFLLHIERQLKKIPAVRGIRWQLDGWTRTSSDWVHKGI